MACGGLAATVRMAEQTQNAVIGKSWNAETIEAACKALAEDFDPISDMRASADVRLLVVQNLLRRFFIETGSGDIETVYSYGR